MAEKIKCKWINGDGKNCKFNSKGKYYCGYHLKYEKLYKPEDIHNLKRCQRVLRKNKICGKPHNNLNKCDGCLEKLERDKQLLIQKRNKLKKKCGWLNQKGEPCPWSVDKNVTYCSRHSIYEGVFTPEDIPLLKKCSGCKNLFKPLTKNKTCIKCQKRSKENRIELYKNCNLCKATIGKTTRRCTYKCLENDDYCGKHQNNKKYNNLIKSGKRICSNWKTGCWNELTKNDKSNCEVCKILNRQKEKKRKRRNIYMIKYNQYLSESKKNRRNIKWELDKQECFKMFQSNCHYCNINFGSNGIDRLDSNKHYYSDNCVSCCFVCNKMKFNHDYNDFISMITMICYNLKLIELDYTKTNIYNNKLFCRSKNKKKYKTYKKNSDKTRKIKMKLTEEQFYQILKYPCYYCGNFKENGANGIDRKNPELCYVTSNVVPCCKTCNFLKGSQKLLHFKQQIVNIYKNICLNVKPNYNNPKIKMISLLTRDNFRITTPEIIVFENKDEYYKNLMFTNNDIENIKIKLIFVDSQHEKYHIWSYYRKNISSFKPKKGHNLCGRRIFILVQDENSGKYLGILSISSDIKGLSKRDEYIGLDTKGCNYINIINEFVNITTCVSTQPFGYNFNGGKLLTSLAFSKEVLQYWFEKYNTHIQGVTTMSLYGKSVQYDRLKCLKYVGLTKGESIKDISKKTIDYAKSYLQELGEYDKKINKNNLWIFKKCLRKLEIPIEDVIESMQKGVYFGFTNPDALDYITRKNDNIEVETPNPIPHNKTSNEICQWWIKRWGVKRYEHLKKNNRVKSLV